MIEIDEKSLGETEPLVLDSPYQVIKVHSARRPVAAMLDDTALRVSASADPPKPAFYLYLDFAALDHATAGATARLDLTFADGARSTRPVRLGFAPGPSRDGAADKRAQIARRLAPGIPPESLRNPGPAFAPFRLEAKGDHVSAHPFEHLLSNLEAPGTGFGIDIGSGVREDPVWNIANVDIFDYPSTDIVAFGDRIPVADGAFDFAICFAVLEHVPNPFEVAREIQRIVKPGGQILVNVPFLQHLHGYPHHYFNMTPDGIAQLFQSSALERHFQDFSCHPIRTLRQVITDYARGLAARDPALARKFLSLKLSDIAGIVAREDPEFLDLPEATMQMIAHSNFSLFRVRWGMADPFRILGEHRPSRWLVTCDHASNRVPPEVAGGDLGIAAEDMARHIAWDVGAAGLAAALGERLDAPVILSDFSRLVIDPNRGEDDPTLLMKLYDGTIIPANRHADAAEVTRRLDLFHRPYHRALERLAARPGTVILAVHSFTPCLKGRPPRPWHVGVLYSHLDERLSRALLARLAAEPDLCIGDNEPYSGHLPGDAIDRHALIPGRMNTLIELRNDLIDTLTRQEAWAARLA